METAFLKLPKSLSVLKKSVELGKYDELQAAGLSKVKGFK